MANETITTTLPQRSNSATFNPFDSVDTKAILTSTGSISSKPKLIISKTVTANDGYYYAKVPTLNIVSEDPLRYFVQTKNKTFANNKYLNSITFEVYFLFNGKDVRSSDGDSFNVISTPKIIPVVSSRLINLATIEGEPITEQGGIRTIKAYGDPGSKVDLVLKDSDDKYWDWNNSVWTTTAVVKKVTLPTKEDFPGYLPQDYLLGVHTEEVRFPRTSKILTHTLSTTPSSGSVISSIEQTDSFGGLTTDLEQVQENSVYLTIKGITDDVYTFNTPFVLGPFTANQPCDVEIYDAVNDTIVTMTIAETDSAAGAFGDASTPLYPTHWSNATLDTLSGWELNIVATVVDSTATNVKIHLAGSVTKAGSQSLTTALDLAGLGSGLLPYS